MRESKTVTHDLKSVDIAIIKKLSKKKIFFGHQSVGQNIVDGIQDLLKEYPSMHLCMSPAKAPVNFTKPCFLHAQIGNNGNPQSKIDDFMRWMTDHIGNQADFAFFKFCYLDFYSTTDVNTLFQTYLNTMNQLKKQFPTTTFIHVTVPLETSPSILKRIIKNMLGRTDHNIIRGKFNYLMRMNFAENEPLFDLAKFESTFPDGRSSTITIKGNVYQTLVPEYTSDGSHLNATGRKIISEQLLLFLMNMH